MVPWSLAAWGMASWGIELPYVAVLVSLAITFCLYYIGYEGLHFLMHKPVWPLITRSRYFRFLEQHHRIHHIRMDRNLNVLVPVADLVLGTFVTEKPERAVTPETARQLARRHSRFGARMRDGAR